MHYAVYGRLRSVNPKVEANAGVWHSFTFDDFHVAIDLNDLIGVDVAEPGTEVVGQEGTIIIWATYRDLARQSISVFLIAEQTKS